MVYSPPSEEGRIRTCAPMLTSPVGNSIDAEYVSVLGGDIILLAGVAIVGDDLTLPSGNRGTSCTSLKVCTESQHTASGVC